MATVNYFAADWAAARNWYAQATGVEPYFLRDGYAEWRRRPPGRTRFDRRGVRRLPASAGKRVAYPRWWR